MGTLVLAMQLPGQRPLSVATITNPRLLLEAARQAIREAEDRVAAASDPKLAKVLEADAAKVRAAVGVLVPAAFQTEDGNAAN